MLGQPVGGSDDIEDLRRALDVMGAHVEQAQSGMHAYIGALTTAQETERGRLARELHDDTVQRLIALAQGVDRVQRALTRDAALAEERLITLRSEITSTVQALRALIADLRPPALEELGLLPAVELLLQQDGDNGIEVSIIVEGTVRRLDLQSELAVFRIIQEGWSNIRRHARASHVWLRFQYTHDALVVTIADDGQGFRLPDNGGPVGAGWGLVGMRERAALVGGEVSLESEPGQGTAIRMHIPYPGVDGRDPICGMVVGPEAISAEYGGALYRFCTPACRELFLAQPEHYVFRMGGGKEPTSAWDGPKRGDPLSSRHVRRTE